MEMERTAEAVGTREELSATWYVALLQLPAVPPSVRAAGLESIHDALGRLPVASRRDHTWHSIHPSLDAAPDILDEPFEDEALQNAPAPALA
jgi:hypothetical protein